MSIWAVGAAYEPYVGRWSRQTASRFLEWLSVPAEGHWLDVGCGTGALSSTILGTSRPAAVTGVDKSTGFTAYARSQVHDRRVAFVNGDAQALPFADRRFDASVSGLVLNFLPDPQRGLGEMARVTRPGGNVAIYVWDYSGGMEMMRVFWDTAAEIDSSAVGLDGGLHISICQPDALERLFSEVGLRDVRVRAIDIPTDFNTFDDYWTPFLGGQGAAPGYVKSLSEEQRANLREHLRANVPTAADGSIHLTARAWAAHGRCPTG